MTAIPHEDLVPQEFSLFQVAFSQFVRMIEGGSSVRSLHRHRYHLGFKIQVDFKGEWVRARFQVRRSAIFTRVSHGTARVTDPIRSTAFTIAICWKRPQNYGLDSQGIAPEQKRTNLGANIVRVRKRAQERNLLPHPGWTPERRGVKPPIPWAHGDATRTHKTTTSRVPYDVDAKCQVNMPKFSRIPDSNENSAYFLHVFQENAKLVKFFANLEEKRISFHSRERISFARKESKTKKTPLVRGNKNSEFKNTNINLIKLN